MEKYRTRQHRSIVVVGMILAMAATSVSADGSHLVYTGEDLLDYIDRWSRRDGLAGQVISDYFLEFLGARPEFFLETMATHMETFDPWVEQLANLSFVDYGTCVDVSCKKESVERSLQLVQVTGDAEHLRIKFLEHLQKIEIRVID